MTPRLDRSSRCGEVIELLPWFLTGALEDQEREMVKRHLAVCSDCRSELGESVVAQELSFAHVPARDLALYGNGLDPIEITVELLGRHLAICPDCRSELEEIRADPETGDGLSHRGRLGLAAALVAALLSVPLLLGRGGESSVPQTQAVGRAAEVELSRSDGALIVFADGFEGGTTSAWEAEAGRRM